MERDIVSAMFRTPIGQTLEENSEGSDMRFSRDASANRLGNERMNRLPDRPSMRPPSSKGLNEVCSGQPFHVRCEPGSREVQKVLQRFITVSGKFAFRKTQRVRAAEPGQDPLRWTLANETMGEKPSEEEPGSFVYKARR